MSASWAIDEYRRIVRAEKRLEKLNLEHERTLAHLSPDDFKVYAEETMKLDKAHVL